MKVHPLQPTLLSFCDTQANILVLQRSHLKVCTVACVTEVEMIIIVMVMVVVIMRSHLEVYGNVGHNHGDERNGEGHTIEHWFWCVALSNTVIE